MSRSKAKTKRRKVWVVIGEDGRIIHEATTRKRIMDAIYQRDDNDVPVKLVEARPGDVVLSREGVAHLMAITEFYPVSAATLAEVRALLRGGR